MAAPIVPPGLQPVIAWCADRPHHLRVVGDRLTWLTGGGRQPTYRWAISLAQVGTGAATGQLLVPGDVPEVELPDGTLAPNDAYNIVDACCEADGTIYYQRDETIRARCPAGLDQHFAALPPCGHPSVCRTVEDLTWSDGRLYVVASESVFTNAREWSRWLVVWTFDRRGDVVQAFRSAAMAGWPYRMRVTTTAGRLVVGFNDRGYLIAPQGVVPLPRWPSELGGAELVLPRSIAWTSTGVVEYAPLEGRVGRTLLERTIERPTAVSAVAVGDWYYFHFVGSQHDVLMGVRADGNGEHRPVIAVDAYLTDMCSDGVALYWLAPDAGAVCRAPLASNGAPCPVVVDDLPASMPPPTLRDTGSGAPFAKVAPPTPHTVTVVQGALKRCATVAEDLAGATPWWGWLVVSLARYHQVHTKLTAAVGDRLWPDGEHVVAEGMTYSVHGDRIYVATSDLRTRIGLASVRSEGGLRVVPDPIFASAWTGFAAWVACLGADHASAPVEARLWRWLPGRDLVEAAARFLVEALGGSVDVAGWMRLPESVVALTAEVATAAVETATLAAAIGDAEVAWPTDLTRRLALRVAHDALIDALLDQGAEAIIDALPALRPGASLTAACDRLLASPCAGAIALDRVLRVLKAHPDTPPSEALRVITAHVTARGDNRHFALCAKYLVETGIDRQRVRAAIRLAAGVGVLAPAGVAPGLVTPFLILPALIVDPGVGIELLRRLLARPADWQQPQAVAMLVAIGAPWCVQELRLARAAVSTDAQRAQVDHALDVLAGTVPLEPTVDFEVYHWRTQLGELSPAHRDAITGAGERARRSALALVPSDGADH